MQLRSPEDIHAIARRKLPRMLFDYVEGSAGTEESDRWNHADLRAIRLPQRVMRDLSATTIATDILGRPSAQPLVLGPVGMAGMLSRRGEIAAARAAKAAGVPFCLSMMSVCSIEEVAQSAGAGFWFQLYMLRDRGFVADLLARAGEAGCGALVVTVDLPMAGLRYRDFKSGLVAPSGWRGRLLRGYHAARRPGWLWDVGARGGPHTLGNLASVMRGGKAMGGVMDWILANYDPSVSWPDLAFVRDHWKGRLIVKGVMHPADAAEALRSGADAVVVSNHGGRQLDGVSSTAAMLPAIRAGIGEAGRVFVDGGARTGSDIVRFLTLGADAVWLGRAWAYALAAGGEAGVAMLLRRLAEETKLAMALSGYAGYQGDVI